MTGETISVSPALLWRLRVLCLTWQALGEVMIAFQVRADRLVASRRFGCWRSLIAAFRAQICALNIILAVQSAVWSYKRLFAEVEMASSRIARIVESEDKVASRSIWAILARTLAFVSKRRPFTRDDASRGRP